MFDDKLAPDGDHLFILIPVGDESKVVLLILKVWSKVPLTYKLTDTPELTTPTI
jgi:hypothetical protein